MSNNEEAPISDLMLDAASLAAPRYIKPRPEEPEPAPLSAKPLNDPFGRFVPLYVRYTDPTSPDLYVEWEEPLYGDDGTHTGNKTQIIPAVDAIARIVTAHSKKFSTPYEGTSFQALEDFLASHWARLVILSPKE